MRIFLLAAAAFPADAPQKPGEKAKLVTRAFGVPISFYRTDESVASGTEQFPELPPASDGGERFNVWSFFEENGLKKIPGAEAIHLVSDRVTVITTTLEEMDLADRILGFLRSGEPVKQAEITAQLWQFDAPQPAADVRPPARLADIRAIDDSNLRMIDQLTTKTKSGQRSYALSTQFTRDAKPSRPAEAKKNEEDSSPYADGLGDDNGSFFEVEPVIGPDGVSFDFQFAYHARLRLPESPEDVAIRTSTNLTLTDGNDTVAYVAQVRDAGPVAGGKVRLRALVIGVRVLPSDGLTDAERKQAELDWEKRMIHKARAGVSRPK